MAERGEMSATNGQGSRPDRRTWLLVAAATAAACGLAVSLTLWSRRSLPPPSTNSGSAEPTPQQSRKSSAAEQAESVLAAAEPLDQVSTPTPDMHPCGPLALECPEGYPCTPEGTCGHEDRVAVPAGPFWMGCNPDDGAPCNRDEQPYHKVTLSTFAIDRTEVTVADYRRCMDAGVCTAPENRMASQRCNIEIPGREEHPVNCVTWDQAARYCLWAMGRLPTEAEWEKAARGPDGRRYPWGEDPPTCDRANLFIGAHQCREGTRPTGTLPQGRSPYGALDMVGNVLEWVSDYYDPHSYLLSDDVDPRGPPSGTDRVLRGGSYGDASEIGHHVWVRYHMPPDTTGQHIGFRCARSLP